MKPLPLRILIIIAFTFSSWTLYAQSNYRPGYIITLSKDTVYGQIDYRTDDMNARRCTFKPDGSSIINTYIPNEINGYRYTDDGKYYVSRVVKLKENVPEQSVFLEYLLQGIRNLYYYEDSEHVRLYFIEKGDGLVKVDAPIINKIDSDGRRVGGTINRYVPILKYVFDDYPDLNSKIDSASFTHKDMIDIAKEYHTKVCKSNEECIEFETKVDKRVVQVYITPYIGFIQYWVPSFIQIGSTMKGSYLIGTNVAFGSRRWMSSLTFCLDLSLSKYRMDYLEMERKKRYDLQLSRTVFSPKIGIRYTYPNKRIRPFIEVLGGLDVMFNSTVKVVQTAETIDYPSDRYLGYAVNAGLFIKYSQKIDDYITLRVGYEGAKTPSFKTTNFHAMSLVLGYTF